MHTVYEALKFYLSLFENVTWTWYFGWSENSVSLFCIVYREVALKRLQENFDESTVAAGSLTAQDMEDTWVAENTAFVAGDRETGTLQ